MCIAARIFHHHPQHLPENLIKSATTPIRVTDQAAVLLALCQRLDSGSIASFPLDVRLPHSPEGIPGLGKHLMKPNKMRSVPCTGNPLPHPAIPRDAEKDRYHRMIFGFGLKSLF